MSFRGLTPTFFIHCTFCSCSHRYMQHFTALEFILPFADPIYNSFARLQNEIFFYSMMLTRDMFWTGPTVN